MIPLKNTHYYKSMLMVALILICCEISFAQSGNAEIPVLPQAEDIIGPSAELLNARAREYIGINQDLAMEYATRALRMSLSTDPDTSLEAGQILMTIGLIHLREDNYQKAIDVLEPALSIFTKYEDTENVTSCNRLLGEAYYDNEDNEKSLITFKKLLPLLQKTNNIHEYVFCTNHIGLIYLRTGRLDSAQVYFQEVVSTIEESPTEKDESHYYNNLGYTMYKQGNFEGAIEAYFLALDKYPIDGRLSTKAIIFNNIGKVYLDQNKPATALEYLRLGQIFSKQSKNTYSIAVSLNSIAQAYESQSSYDSALAYYQKSLEEYKHSENPQGFAQGVVLNLVGIARIHNKLGHNEKALANAEEAYQTAEKSNYKSGMADALFITGEIYAKQKNSRKAIDTYIECIEISGNVGRNEMLMDAYLIVSKIYENLGLYKDSINYYKKYSAVHDSLFNEDIQNRIQSLMIAYEAQQKDRENQLLRETKRKQEAEIQTDYFTIALFGISAVFALGVLFALYRLYYTKKRQTKRIIEQRDKISLQNSELEEAISKVKTLSGLLPICPICKKIRNDQGYWQQVEEYVSQHTDVDFSHGICPQCFEELYPELNVNDFFE